MRESKNVFLDRIDKIHIQCEEVNKFYKLCQEGRMLLGIEEDEFKKLLNDLNNDHLEHSNDMVIDMIINNIKKYTNDLRLKDILENINIANVSDPEIIGRAYPKYYDDSYYIEFEENIDKKIMLLSDIFAVLFMYQENINSKEKSLLDELLSANIQRYNKNEKFNDLFDEVQIKMLLNNNNNFTDKYVAYSREIYEMAIATLIGHEVGHHYLMHTDRDIEINKDNKIKEFEADCYGVDFAFDYLQSSYIKINNSYRIHQFSGIYLLFIASADFCDNIFTDGKKHPSIKKRLDAVQKKLEQKIDKEEYQNVKKYISKLCEKIQFKGI